MGEAPPDSNRRTSFSRRAHPAWHLLGALAVVAWAAVMAAMFWPADRAVTIPLDEKAFYALLENGEEWQGLYLGDRHIGHGMTRLREADGHFTLEQKLYLRLRLAGEDRRFENRLWMEIGPDFSILALEFEASVSGLGMAARGRLENGKLVASVTLGPEALRFEQPLPRRFLLEPLLLRRLAKEDLSPGRRFRAEVFDPRSLSPRQTEIRVVALEALPGPAGLRPAVHLRRSLSGVVLDTWIDGEGRVLREESSLGFRAQREERSSAEREPPEAAPELDREALHKLLPALSGVP